MLSFIRNQTHFKVQFLDRGKQSFLIFHHQETEAYYWYCFSIKFLCIMLKIVLHKMFHELEFFANNQNQGFYSMKPTF